MEMTSKETNDKLLKLAKRRVLLKEVVKWHIIIYLIINALLCAIYYLTTPTGYFWPIWSIIGWGIGLIIHIVVTRVVLSSTRGKQDLVEKEYQMLLKDFELNNGKSDWQSSIYLQIVLFYYSKKVDTFLLVSTFILKEQETRPYNNFTGITILVNISYKQ